MIRLPAPICSACPIATATPGCAPCKPSPPEETRAHFEQALTSALLTVSPGTHPRLTGPDCAPLERRGFWRHGDLPGGETFRPPLLARAVYRAARAARLVLTPTGIVERDADGDLHKIRLDQAVGMERDGNDRTLFGGSGCVITASADAVPAELTYEVSALRPPAPDAHV
ncbi:hypothetical protein [Streptomyces clavifer]|uniref:hypothetical protein n=1 Tax=Streptomyces clavifer TaxID=68188 RepID=UPI0036761F24